VVTISQNGCLHALSFPADEDPGPARLFSQILNANICSADILDIDNDGHCTISTKILGQKSDLGELVVVMTDRVSCWAYNYIKGC
jgi:hypothetical protein